LVKKGQVYKHFKGNYYYVEDIAYDSASNDGDLKEIVIYRALYGDNKLWIRPMEEFESKKFLNDTYVKRFTLIEFEKIDVPNRNI
jgi:hypothetical protein